MIILKIKDRINLNQFKIQLIDLGYELEKEMSRPGCFYHQGDVLSIWPVNYLQPIRIDLFGNNIEAIQQEIERTNQSLRKKIKELGEINILDNRIKLDNHYYNPGSYIVHPHHGIGVYRGFVTKKYLETNKTYLELEYAQNDKIYFPIERQKELMIYIGSKKPRLTRLNSQAWKNTKQRVKKNLFKLAKELLTIYSLRSVQQREPFPLDKSFLNVLDQDCQFSLTSDQEASLNSIITGLTENPRPQDHLIVGDAGFGKTEIALRAASIVLAAGKQVAILAPTTLLVNQHYTLAKERFAKLPVKIAELSRLSHSGEDIIKSINKGNIDLIIATHKLLSKQIQLKNLGLLIIDEEQRFGVIQKEKLKKIKTSLDIVSLSATPIPRTLFMSLSGLREMSLISTAPPGRQGVEVTINQSDESVIVDFIQEELSRKGQIYFIHNRVRSINAVRLKLGKILKKSNLKARIGIAHGQQLPDQLSANMSGFLAGKIDILLSSTIVENGLDHPNANTLIVDRAETFGLADLYQLRGRVGRREQKAKALFLIGSCLSKRQDLPLLTKTAKDRLETLKTIDQLGGGWQLALKDLEIRGAGNLLGREQHGFMEAIGLILYSQLLQEVVKKMVKNQP